MTKLVKTKLWDGHEPWKFAQLKRDGMWVTLTKSADGHTSAHSRMPRNISHQLNWHPAYQAFKRTAAPGTTLYCEAFVAGGVREDVKGAMRDENPNLRLECFATPNLPEDASLFEVSDFAWDAGLPFVGFLTSGALNFDGLVDAEGWMLKDGNMLNWRKLKPVYTYDLRIVGFTDAREGKYSGLIGAVMLADATGRVVTQVSGMSDDIRRDLTERPEYYLNKVLEVEAQGLGSAGGLMHPRWSRIRDDKDTLDDLTSLSAG